MSAPSAAPYPRATSSQSKKLSSRSAARDPLFSSVTAETIAKKTETRNIFRQGTASGVPKKYLRPFTASAPSAQAFVNPAAIDPAARLPSAPLRPLRRRIRLPRVQILQRRHFHFMSCHRANPARRRARRRQRRNARNVVTHRRAPDRFLVVKRFAAQRRINHHIQLRGFDQVHNIRPPFIHFVDRFHFNPRAGQRRGRPARRHHFQSRRQQILHHKRHMPLVVIVHAQEHRPLLRQPLPRRQLRLRKRQPERRRNSHHLARRPHLRPQNRIHAAELVERKHRRLHRVKIPHRQFHHATD